MLGWKNLNLEDTFWSNIDDKLVLLDRKIEKYHILIDKVLNVEFEIEVKTFRKWPFYIAIYHLDTCLPAISYKIIARLLLQTLLLFE